MQVYDSAIDIYLNDEQRREITVLAYTRITSYNVCYTKLLRRARRFFAAQAGVQEPLAGEAMIHLAPATLEEELADGDASSVITSYSIHYTKLYDCGACWSHRLRISSRL